MGIRAFTKRHQPSGLSSARFLPLVLLALAFGVVSCGEDDLIVFAAEDSVYEFDENVEISWQFVGEEPPDKFTFKLFETATGELTYEAEIDATRFAAGFWTATPFQSTDQGKRPGEYRVEVSYDSSDAAASTFLYLTPWDWTRPQTIDIEAPPGVPIPDELPYFDQDGLLAGDFKVDDVHPRNGWVLLELGIDEETPRFVIYNRFSGTLRVFYFYLTEPGSGARSRSFVTLSQPNTSPDLTPLIAFSNPGGVTLQDDDGGSSTLIYDGFAEPNRWNYADFPVLGFVPDLQDDAELQVAVWGRDISEVLLEDSAANSKDVNLETEGTQGAGTVSDFADVLEVAGEANKSFSTAKKALDSIKKNFGFLEPLLSSKLGTAAPYLWATASILDLSLVPDGSGPSQVRVQNGLKISGTITTDRLIGSFRIAVPGSRQVTQPEHESLYPYPLGIFNIVSRPIMTAESLVSDRVDSCAAVSGGATDQLGAGSQDEALDLSGALIRQHSQQLSGLEVEVNPFIGRAVVIEAAYKAELSEASREGTGEADETKEILVDFAEPDSQGRLHRGTDGFFPVEDLLSMTTRVGFRSGELCGTRQWEQNRRDFVVKAEVQVTDDWDDYAYHVKTYDPIYSHSIVPVSD